MTDGPLVLSLAEVRRKDGDRLGCRPTASASRIECIIGDMIAIHPMALVHRDHPEFARFLVEHGIDSISVGPDSFLAVKEHVAAAARRRRDEPSA